MLRLLLDRAAEDPVVIDWNHGSSPSYSASEDPLKGGSLGLVVGGWIETLEEGVEELVVIPAYNTRGVDVVEQNRGALWNSPEFLVGRVFAREADDAEEIGTAQLLAVALTNRPAQVATTAEAVTLTESGSAREEDMADEQPQEVRAECDPEEQEMMEPEPEEAEDESISMAEHQAAVQALEEQIQALKDKYEGEEAEKVAASESIVAEVTKLREELNHERALREHAEDEGHFQTLLAEGRCAPAEKETLVRALGEKRAGRPWMYDALFGSREANSVVPLTEQGHSQKVEPEEPLSPSEQLHAEVKAYAEQHQISNYAEAFRAYIRTQQED